MEDIPVNSTSESGYREEDDEFYEKIEAPKFVDFTLPRQPLPDDRAWFCLRVGCDQKHEEDTDPDTIYKNFVLRVMAARSPNVKLGKALYKQMSIGIPKCPLSAPPSSRVPRLPVMSSISQNHGAAKVKVTHIPSKFKSTPSNGKLKPSSTTVRSLTTPRNKEKKVQNLEPFLSVRNPKATNLIPKNREVAKALVFTSPVKKQKQDNNQEGGQNVCPVVNPNGESSNISLADKCTDMKKLKSRRKTKCIPSRYASTFKRPKPLSKACDVKSKQAKKLSVSRDFGGQKGRLVKKKMAGKGNFKKCDGTASVPRSEMENNRKLDVEEKGSGKSANDVKDKETSISVTKPASKEISNSRTAGKSIEGKFYVVKVLKVKNNIDSSHIEDIITEVENNEKSDVEEKGSGKSANNVKDKETSISATQESAPMEISHSRSNEKSIEEGNALVVKVVKDSDNIDSSHIKDILPDSSVQITNVTNDGLPMMMRVNMESLDSQMVIQAENSMVCQTNRQVVATETLENPDKENTSASECNRDIKFDTFHFERSKKPLKEGALVSNQGTKLKKTKHTNPKPFRLRTDERSILKEARSILKEANLEKRRLHEPLGPSEFAPHSKIKKECPNNEFRVRSTCPKSAGSKEPKAEMRALQRLKMDGKKKTSPQTQSNAVKSRGLTLVDPSSNSDPKYTSTINKAVSRGKRRPTILKEPVFHQIHGPKSCCIKSQI